MMGGVVCNDILSGGGMGEALISGCSRAQFHKSIRSSMSSSISSVEHFSLGPKMSRRTLTEVKIVDIQKRKVPSKHYVSKAE